MDTPRIHKPFQTHSQVGGDTDADTDNDTTGVHDAQSSLRASSALDASANAEDDTGKAKTPLATEVVTDRVSQEGAKEASCLVQ